MLANLFHKSEKKTMIKRLGLRNIVSNGTEWRYLLFYEVDNPSKYDITEIINFLEEQRLSYLMYETKGGIHIVGLTPLTLTEYAIIFSALQTLVPEYMSGQTIRLSRKEGERQSLVFHNFDYPIIPNLLQIYVSRFFANGELKLFEEFQEHLITDTHWNIVPEKYWSYKK